MLKIQNNSTITYQFIDINLIDLYLMFLIDI
jgi:hypothetical protein